MNKQLSLNSYVLLTIYLLIIILKNYDFIDKERINMMIAKKNNKVSIF
jgi:hypothetical protein